MLKKPSSGCHPEREGFIASLARPGGNITGAMVNAGDLVAKRLQMLLEMSPRVTRIAYLMNPDNVNHSMNLANIQAAAQKAKVTIVPVAARTSQDIDGAFAVMKRERADLPVVQPTLFELFINGKTAKALGLKISHALLITAEKVIE